MIFRGVARGGGGAHVSGLSILVSISPTSPVVTIHALVSPLATLTIAEAFLRDGRPATHSDVNELSVQSGISSRHA